MSCCRFARQLFSVSCCFNACSPAPFDVRSRHIFHTPVIPILCRQGSVQQKIAHRRLASRPGLLTATPIFGRKSSLPLPASRTAEKNRAAALHGRGPPVRRLQPHWCESENWYRLKISARRRDRGHRGRWDGSTQFAPCSSSALARAMTGRSDQPQSAQEQRGGEVAKGRVTLRSRTPGPPLLCGRFRRHYS